MKPGALVLSLLLLVAAVAGAATAADSDSSGVAGWLKPKSAKSGGKPTTRNVSAAGSKPSMMTNITNAPKRFVSSTKTLLSPKKSQSAPAKRSTASSRVSSKSNPPQSPGFFKSLFSPEEPPPPKTVGDWMKLKQVRP